MCSRKELELIRRRPRLYLASITYSALAAYIHGIQKGIYELQTELGLKELPPIFREYNWTWEYYFDLWTQFRHECGPALGYFSLIKINDSSRSDEERFHLFFKYLDEFEQEFEVRGQSIVLKELEAFKAKRDGK